MSDRRSAREIAVSDLSRDLAVTAGAGAGKTSVLVDRFVNIARDPSFGPERILAITFTRKAAVEMKERVIRKLVDAGESELRHRAESAYISTIHAFAERLLRDHPFEARVDPAFEVIDEMAEALFFQEALVEMHGDAELRSFATRIGGERTGGWALFPLVRDIARRMREGGAAAAREAEFLLANDDDACVEQIMLRARALRSSSVANGSANGSKSKASDETSLRELEHELLPLKRAIYRAARRISDRYAEYKRRECKLDFHDLQERAAALLREHEKIRGFYADLFRHILLDEAQDTDELQHEIVNLLRDPSILFMVGDPKQAIYEFRGANPELFDRVVEQLPTDSRLHLRENFRSRQEIVGLVNAIGPSLLRDQFAETDACAEYRERELAEPAITMLWAEHRKDVNGKEELVGDARVREAAAVAEEIGRQLRSATLVRDPQAKDVSWIPIRPKHIAVLFRTRVAIPYFELALAQRGIPYVTAAGQGFYERAEVLDGMMMLRVLAQPLDDLAMAAVLRSPWFGVRDAALWRLRAQDGKSSGAEGRERDDPRPLYRVMSHDEELRPIRERIDVLRRRTRGKSASDALEDALKELHYEEAVASHADGTAMLANLAKLRRELRGMGSISALEAFHELEQRREILAAEAVAPIFGAADDAVVLVTVHGAKGLEWPMVCLPDLQGVPRNGRDLFSARHGTLLCKAIDAKGKKVDSFSVESVKQDEKRRSDAEERRLLYVGLTRAREKLVLSASVKESMWTPKVKGEYGSPFRFLMRELPQLATPGRHVVSECTIEVRRVTDDVTERTSWTRGNPLAASIDPQIMTEEPVEHSLTAALPSSLKVTELLSFRRCPQVHRFAHVLEIPESQRRGNVSRAPIQNDVEAQTTSAIELGTIVHAMLERARFDAEDIEAEIARLADSAAPHDRTVIERMVRSVLAGEIGEAARAGTRVEREWPIALRIDGVVVEGVIDLAIQRPDGRWMIVDYKSNDFSPSGRLEHLIDQYTPQLDLYALALSRCGLGEVAECALVFLAGPVVRRWRFDPSESKIGTWAEATVQRIAVGDHATTAGPKCEMCAYRKRKICSIGRDWDGAAVPSREEPRKQEPTA